MNFYNGFNCRHTWSPLLLAGCADGFSVARLCLTTAYRFFLPLSVGIEPIPSSGLSKEWYGGRAAGNLTIYGRQLTTTSSRDPSSLSRDTLEHDRRMTQHTDPEGMECFIPSDEGISVRCLGNVHQPQSYHWLSA